MSGRTASGRRAGRRRTWILVAAAVVLVVVAVVAWVRVATGGSDESAGPPESALGAGTGMGAVELRTDDVDALRTFYEEGVGLETIEETDGSVTLGADGRELIRLVAASAPADDMRQAGLYHSAFLYPDDASLAVAVARTAGVAPTGFQGSSDHRVSQAFYFADPAGNGVELYADRPADQWEWTDGLVGMGSEFLDPNAFVNENLDPAVDGAPIMGHVHLRGGDLAQAEAFYADALGFAVTARSDGALFFAAGGYHHHLAVNVWSSAGAGDRPESLGLGAVTLQVPSADEIDALEERLTEQDIAYERTSDAIAVDDPWGTRIDVVVAP